MVLQETEAMVQTVLADTILTACRKNLPYDEEFSVEGMLHITLDKKEIILVNIKNTILKADEKDLSHLKEETPDVPLEKKSSVKTRKRGRPRKSKTKVKYYGSDDEDNVDDDDDDDDNDNDNVNAGADVDDYDVDTDEFSPLKEEDEPQFPNLYSQMYTGDEKDDEEPSPKIKEEPTGDNVEGEMLGTAETTAQLQQLAMQLSGVAQNEDEAVSNNIG